ncbi:lytic transglycosylase domain-containing protein [Jeotgalibacillus sp. ET6]|uniref:lytic transglycosylase domain-containing protein n=1 Tax=Jeotgalibacillus sp. ET6 TaxID=3037260 RepID=UPI0024187C5A|nr:lytic transglycosylase domain-containing protein [Jeotgalibacillus sp. ET6]MDG5470406.1 lytic transglycosylase domain-containing protein [Jeotgalibacillus sp. ET6]
MKKKKKSNYTNLRKVIKVAGAVIAIFITLLAISVYMVAQNDGIIGKTADWLEKAGAPVELEVPPEYIEIYQRAEEEYGVPWTLLAAHHRVETRFSTMETMVSPVGAEGHMQFMPCTFVGWSHPTCEGLGEGDIPADEMKDPAVIEQYGGYGTDGNGDGIADPWDIEDAVYSAAHYLSKNGAADGDLERAIFTYNQSDEYVEDVLYYFNQYEDQLN